MTSSPASPPTLEAVAERAGVSRATVSRVVNNSPKVTAEVVAAVNVAIKELGYVPNRAARSLASRRTFAIALVVPEDSSKVFDEPYFANIVQGIARFVSNTEYTLTLVFASAKTVAKTNRYLLGGNVDGALVVSHHAGDQLFSDLHGKLPLVFGGRPLVGEGEELYYVDTDNVGAAQRATELFIKQGRTRIATIAGPADMSVGVDRLQGWRQALQAAGMDDSLVEHGDFSPASGAAAMRWLLQRGSVDAVLAANDLMAAGAYSVLAEAGLRIPQDVAVIGFDDDKFAAAAVPPLTSVSQPASDMGSEMARNLVRLIEGGKDVSRVTVMPTRLVVRQSTGTS